MATIANASEYSRVVFEQVIQRLDILAESVRKPGALQDLDALVHEQVLGLTSEKETDTLASAGPQCGGATLS
jgi:hypothetical protein